jgi:hypothetical protein
MQPSIFTALGLDAEDLSWEDLALCSGMNTDWFYDDYDDEAISHMVDEACLSCPVMKQCMQQGVEGNEWGVWAGVYLVSGKADLNKNKYKSKETWARIRKRLVDE